MRGVGRRRGGGFNVYCQWQSVRDSPLVRAALLPADAELHESTGAILRDTASTSKEDCAVASHSEAKAVQQKGILGIPARRY